MKGSRGKKRSLKTEFFAAVSFTLLVVALVSGVTVFACWRFRKWLVPDENRVRLNVVYSTPDGKADRMSALFEVDSGEEQRFPDIREEKSGEDVSDRYDIGELAFFIESVDHNIGSNGPRRRLAYIGAGIAMGVLPAAYAVAGFFLCAVWFYRRKLSPAITILDDAAQHISCQDLDFTVACGPDNELGGLCRSFERMRQALDENNRALWKSIEGRKLLQASVAHDLRNPIAIIEGYTEYLQIHLQTDDLTPARIREIAGSIDKAAKRLEQYTESVREIDRLDDMELCRTEVDAGELAEGIGSDLAVMASEAGKVLRTAKETPSGRISADVPMLYRILENVMRNALRYAGENIDLTFALQDKELIVSVADDGPGFPEEILKSRNRLLMPADESGHCGMGLAISRLLCQKHGGRLELANREPSGACVKISVAV